MKISRVVFFIIGMSLCSCFYSFAQPVNDNCSSAMVLYSNAVCFPPNQTTVGASLQAGEVTSPTCWFSGPAINQSIWFKFQATASSMYAETQLTGIAGPGNGFNEGRWITVVYNTLTCVPGSGSIISCKNEDSQGEDDDIQINNLTGLTVGNWYLIQVGYRTGSYKSPVFCLNVGDNITPPSSCASPWGPACELSSAPSVTTTVTSSCGSYEPRPYLEGGVSTSQCYTFTPTQSTISFGVVINSTCPNLVNSWGQLSDNFATSSNTGSFSWTIQPSDCSAAIASGNSIGSMASISGLTIGTSYTFCYTLSVPDNCFQAAYYPYFYYPVVLPIELTSFSAANTSKGVDLNWSTASELNNDYFSLQHSVDGMGFDNIATIAGAGNSNHSNTYEYTDHSPAAGINYYRLVQHDFDGSVHYSDVVSVNVSSPVTAVEVIPNPAVDNGNVLQVISNADRNATVEVFDAIGRLTYTQKIALHAGMNNFDLNIGELDKGIYNLIVLTSDGNRGITFIK